MFTFDTFFINHLNIALVFPETSHAKPLFDAINQDRDDLSRWMPWAKTTQSIDDEIKFINYARIQNAKSTLFELVIVANNQAVGMIDLHHISPTNKTAELGYWLASHYQGKGIISESVNRLVAFAFDQLDLHKIILQADSENDKSIAVAQRLGFKHEGSLKDQITYQNQFKTLEVFAKFSH